jgi:HPt (histidine-containing phosphotransfer) domain-containing protein
MSDTAPPVDLDAFRAAMREAGIEEIVESTLQLWVEETPAKFAKLEAAVSAADPRAAANAAHTLKSSSSAICATLLADALNALESAGYADERERVATLFAEARQRYREAIEYLTAHS